MDPVYAGLFDPQQWNRYAYARNNPLTFVDPDGRAISCYETGRGVRCNEDLTVTPESGSPHGPPLILISGREPDCVPGLASRACGFVKNPVRGAPDPGDRRRRSPGGGGDEQVSQTINPLTDVLGQAAPVSQALAAGAVAGLVGAANLPILTATRLPFVAAGIRAAVYSNPNTLNHIFAPKHYLHLLGSRSTVLRQLSSEVARSFLGGQLGRGPFNEVYYMNGYVVRVTGAVVNGAPRISNAWVIRRMGT